MARNFQPGPKSVPSVVDVKLELCRTLSDQKMKNCGDHLKGVTVDQSLEGREHKFRFSCYSLCCYVALLFLISICTILCIVHFNEIMFSLRLSYLT